jgi:predicted RNase H-like HicB family nuclease
MALVLQITLTREDNLYVARCADPEVASQGKTIKEALSNVGVALELYFDPKAEQRREDPLGVWPPGGE